MSYATTHYALISGGLDSMVMLKMLMAIYSADRIKALSIDYGQRHIKETAMAQQFCAENSINRMILSIPRSIYQGQLLTDKSQALPEKSYAELPEGTSPTYVPFRNGLFISLLAARAQAHMVQHGIEYGKLYIGVTQEDGERAAYPDCTPEFIAAMREAILISTVGRLELEAPFVRMSKAGIVKIGWQLKLDFAATWSCYKGDEFHCGTCPTCQARRSAFIAAGVNDPTIYQDHGEV